MEDVSVSATTTNYIYDPNLLDAAIDTVQSAIQEIVSLANEITEKYDARARIDLKWIADFAVDNFYDSRDPFVYKRRESLYKAYDIIVENGFWNIQTKADNLSGHHQSNEIIFNNVFLQGFHGGSTGTDKNGDTALSPAWRTPVPKYTHWGANAAQASESPEDEITREFEKYLERKRIEKQNEFDRRGNIIISKVEAAVRALKNSRQ